MMKRIFAMACLLMVSAVLSAQADKYEQRYDLLVSQFGPAGVGVETVLNNWEKVDSTNAKMLMGRFSYWFTKAQIAKVEMRPSRKYLGMDPMLTLKDSLGNDVYYYQVNVFDDEMYGEAVKAADKAIRTWPDRLDFRFMKANAYIAYEKESPDMALAYLLSLADENRRRSASWSYEGADADQTFFQEAMQEYCYSFYSIGTPASYDAFLALSVRLAEQFPDNVEYMCNIGSYYMIAKEDYKTACKYYNKVLKQKPDDYTAIRNSVLASRKMKNVKMEKKYLQMLVKYGPEKDRLTAQGRLMALNK